MGFQVHYLYDMGQMTDIGTLDDLALRLAFGKSRSWIL